jgi:DNA repair exonuclease SbcCD ATPase subunit
LPLTVENVKEALPEKHARHLKIDTRFQNIDVSEYDTIHKTFTINRAIYVANNSYACPIHSDIIGKEGDKCSVCGKELEKKKEENHKELDVINQTDMLSH